MRLAMLFALADRSLVIEAWHLRAALAWVNYSVASVRYVFADQAREARAMERDDIAQRIVEFLTGRPDGATLRDIHNDCFSKKTTPVPVANVLSMMLAEPAYGLEMEERPRSDGRAGKLAKVYRLSKKSFGHSGHSGHRGMTRPAELFKPADFGGHSFFEAPISANNDLSPPMSDTEKTAGSRMNALCPLSPLSPRENSETPPSEFLL
jgi:hypothetical protein